MVLVFLEADESEVPEEGQSALTMARGIAEERGRTLHAAVIGKGQAAASDIAGDFGVETLHVVTNEDLLPYNPEGWVEAIEAVVDEISPEVVMGAGTERTQELLARLGARRDQPMAANCNEVTPGEPYTVIRQRWGGSLLEEATIEGSPILMSITPHETPIGEAPSATEPSIEEISVDFDVSEAGVTLARVEETDIEGVPLGEARVVIGGGRGVGGPDGFDQLETLADLLGGTVGSSRAAVNEGWRPHDDQIGLTGAKISPELYIPCGISGAVQHWVGCKGAKHILAINTDSEAAIVQRSNWAIIGDLHEVIPAIIEEIESR